MFICIALVFFRPRLTEEFLFHIAGMAVVSTIRPAGVRLGGKGLFTSEDSRFAFGFGIGWILSLFGFYFRRRDRSLITNITHYHGALCRAEGHHLRDRISQQAHCI